MAIASDLPFKLQVIKRFPNISYQEGVIFSNDAKEIWEQIGRASCRERV